jgi:hypothetical protein
MKKKLCLSAIQKNKRSFLFSLIIIMGACLPGASQNYIVSAQQKWVDTQIDLSIDEDLEISSKGTWTNGGTTPQWVGPEGWSGVTINSTLAPGLPFSSLIGKIADNTFFIGDHFKGKSLATGRLYLSMNDNDFSDNDGKMQVAVSLSRVLVLPFPRDKEISSFIPPDKILPLVQSFFSDGKVQLSQTGEGVPLSIRFPNGSVSNSMSYVSFGSTMSGFGVDDIDIPLPENEISPEQIKNTGGASIFAQYIITHSFVFADRFRFLLNNIHAYFGSDLSISLGNNEILLNLSLHSPDPAIRGEGNGYTGFLGIPIPLGWQDGLCPDISIKDLGLTIHLVPVVAADGTLHFQDPVVDVSGTPAFSTFDWLSLAQQIKDKAMNSFKENIAGALKQDKAKKGLESGVLGVFPIFTGKENKNIGSIVIDNTGILINYTQ